MGSPPTGKLQFTNVHISGAQIIYAIERLKWDHVVLGTFSDAMASFYLDHAPRPHAIPMSSAYLNAMRASLQRSRVLDDPNGLHSGGETRQATMLMSDLRGFTALTERLTPQQALAFLNRYLERMAYDGVINEMLGDGIFVLFGARMPRRTTRHGMRRPPARAHRRGPSSRRSILFILILAWVTG